MLWLVKLHILQIGRDLRSTIIDRTPSKAVNKLRNVRLLAWREEYVFPKN